MRRPAGGRARDSSRHRQALRLADGDAPGKIAARGLPYIHGDEAQALVDDAVALLVPDFGYRRADRRRRKRRKNGAGGDRRAYRLDYDFADHDQLAALAMKLIKSGMSAGAAVNFLRAQVEGLTNVDPDRKARRLTEIPAMVDERAGKARGRSSTVRTTRTAAAVDARPHRGGFPKWLLLEDVWPVYVTLGAIAANHLPGPPVWLGLIAPPSSAKTEILSAMLRLPKVELMTTASPAALLSGTPKKQMAHGARAACYARSARSASWC